MNRWHFLAAWLVLLAANPGWADEPFPPLVASEFSPASAVGRVEAISLDGAGRVYVALTNRRSGSVPDIRAHRDWVVESLGAASLEDRRALLRKRYGEGRPGDANGDGRMDWKDLTVASEAILSLEDTDGDGRVDRRTILAEGFRSEITGVAGSVLAHGGGVYAAVAPSLWNLRDSDGNGKAEERVEMATGFGLSVGYPGHGMRNLLSGPDGKIYWSVGDAGLSVTGPSGTHRHLPNQGAVLRFDPGGANLEVFARGFRNPRGLAFDDFGNLFVCDDDDDGARFYQVLEGSDAGWRSFYQYRDWETLGELRGYNVWVEENLGKTFFAGQTAAITPCLTRLAEGVAGFAYNPGTALGEAYEGHFILADSRGQNLRAFRLRPQAEGAGFALGVPHVVLEGRNLGPFTFGPDGALYAVESGGGDEAAAEAGSGGILRLDVAEGQGHPMRAETAQWRREDLRRLPEGRLLTLLGYPDQRVRLAAQFEIVERGDFTILRQTAIADSRKIARIHGIWGCAQLVKKRAGESLQSLASLAKHRDPEIRAEMIRALGETRSFFALGVVKDALFASHSQVRLRAALALHHLAGPRDLKDITDYIAAQSADDPFLRHGGVRALTGAARAWPELLVDLHEHASHNVRLAAAVALRRMHESAEEGKTLQDPEAFAGLAKFLTDKSETIVLEAARGIHDVGKPSRAALSALAEMLGRTSFARGPLLQRIINANRLVGDLPAADRLLQFGSDSGGGVPENLREEALRSAATWTRELKLDRLLGSARPVPAAPYAFIRQALDSHHDRLATRREEALRTLVGETGYKPGASR